MRATPPQGEPRTAAEKVLVLDFGSQYAQLIARRVREQQVYCEIVRHDITPERIEQIAPRGLILSGGPASVYEDGAPQCDPRIFRLGIPVLGVAGLGGVGNRSVYVDVYVMESTAQMELLNVAAVNGTMVEPHAEIAALYGSGAGSLYGVRAGDLEAAAHSYWFSKPAGMSYAEMDSALAGLITAGVALLRRMMVLGPSPEFCMFSPAELTLPAPFVVEHRPLTSL